jgi:hypothetical protein
MHVSLLNILQSFIKLERDGDSPNGSLPDQQSQKTPMPSVPTLCPAQLNPQLHLCLHLPDHISIWSTRRYSQVLTQQGCCLFGALLRQAQGHVTQVRQAEGVRRTQVPAKRQQHRHNQAVVAWCPTFLAARWAPAVFESNTLACKACGSYGWSISEDPVGQTAPTHSFKHIQQSRQHSRKGTCLT